MNVIISNKYQSMLQSLDIDIIKSLEGEFDVDYIISTFQNFFFQRMILDITAIQNYKDIKTLQKLSIGLDMEKVILLLDDSEESTSASYLSDLISMGIYNFTKNVEGIMYLYHNPNTYRDVAHIHQLNHDPEIAPPMTEQYLQANGPRILGIKNITKQSGATTLTYMMKKQLEKNYSVVALELNKRDFSLFREKDMISTSNNEIAGELAKHHDKDIVLIDINDSTAAENFCQDIIYLIEPSMIKLNRLMMLNPKSLDALKNKKVILNQSLLSSKDVLDFEYESRVKIFYNMPPLDERETEIHALNMFLVRLGFDRQTPSEETEKKNKLLGLFNF